MRGQEVRREQKCLIFFRKLTPLSSRSWGRVPCTSIRHSFHLKKCKQVLFVLLCYPLSCFVINNMLLTRTLSTLRCLSLLTRSCCQSKSLVRVTHLLQSCHKHWNHNWKQVSIQETLNQLNFALCNFKVSWQKKCVLTNSQELRDVSKAQAIWRLGAREKAADGSLWKPPPKRDVCTLEKIRQNKWENGNSSFVTHDCQVPTPPHFKFKRSS